MMFYNAFLLPISSDITLPGYLEMVAYAVPEIQLERAVLANESVTSDHGDHIVGIAPGMFRFRAVEGRLLQYDLLPEAEPSFVQAILSGELMAVLLRQRGLLVLHASCVVKDGKAWVFIGESGWGKSTTALHLVQHHGFTLVADDITAIDLGASPPRVLPGPAQMRLGTDVGERYIDTFEDLTVAHAFTRKKLYIHEQRPIQEAVPIAHIFVLEPDARELNEVVSLERQTALQEIIRHTRGRKLLSSPAYMAAHLQQSAQLVTQVPVHLLKRTRRLQDLEEVSQRILNVTSVRTS